MAAIEHPVEEGKSTPMASSRKYNWIFDILLVIILVAGGYFRLVGVHWDDNTHLHPDERFLTMVETAITPVPSLAQYFNTATSSLNPANRGYTFFVYGTLPIFIVRYVAQAVSQTGYNQVDIVGRYLSALADLLTVLLVYLIALRLYNRKVGLLAAAFAAFSVLPIQLSHYFTVDTFTNFFGFLAVYFAIWILTKSPETKPKLFLVNSVPYALFGLALGMATASKINAAALAFLLPLVEFIRLSQKPKEEQQSQILPALGYLAVAAVVSLLVFRIFQPYAFTGPGFFNIKPNQNFINNMISLSNQANGNVDFPPALQWADRPLTFSWTNMVDWGLGLPLGLLAWGAFLWMGWRIIKGQWRQHLVLWIWTGAYFIWQSISFTKSMRYQMLIYPTLAIIAAWALVALWEKGKTGGIILPRIRINFWRKPAFWRILASVLGSIAVLGTLAWAFAFTRIYTRPLTRVAASDWIYQNVPGPINLKIATSDGSYNQPISYHSGSTVQGANPYTMAFISQQDGAVTQVTIPYIIDTNTQTQQTNKTIRISLASPSTPMTAIASGTLTDMFDASGGDPRGSSYTVSFDFPALIKSGEEYLLRIDEIFGQGSIQIMGPLQLTVMDSGYPVYQSLPPPVQTITTLQSYSTIFSAQADGLLGEVYLPHLVDQSALPGTKILQVSISPLTSAGSNLVSTGTVTGEFPMTSDGRGGEYLVKLDTPLPVLKQNLYSLNIKIVSGTGNIAVYGSAPALESSWDDALPQPINGYAPFDYYNGIYQGDLNFEMYNDDNLDKLKRFETTLDEADYIFISSNRQWATTVRVPQRYPLTIDYYRNLLGCPADQSIIWCYSVAEPGMFTGTLGYKLVAVFQSDPNLGPIQINDQFAEEAFTVYDHPKVMIFEKEASYSSQTVRDILGAVDLSNVIHVTPREAGSLPAAPKTLMLSSSQMAIQTAGGTWSQLFDWNAIQNKYQPVGVIIWYLAVFLLGLLVYPLIRIAFPGLSDRGYPLARTAGLLLLSFLVWIGGSEGIPFTRVTITIAILILAVVGGALAFYQREQLKEEWRTKSRYFLMVEGLVLAFFVIDLIIRLGNPDLWHPYYGGEKPMDFSFFNAVIKSTTFPPYDPWFAGGYINYYYYGYVIVGVLVKWLGIVPSIAYNLILPTLFALVAMGAFSFGWNIIQSRKKANEPFQDDTEVEPEPDPVPDPESTAEPLQSEEAPAAVRIGSGVSPLARLKKIIHVESDPDPSAESITKNERSTVFGHPFWIGLASAIGLLILGNLGTVRMIWHGFQKLAAPGGNIADGSVLTHWLWSIQGFFVFLSGTGLPITTSDWYWVPSRAISTVGGNEITEFPFFTFIYADLHAHLIALGITILALIWALAIILGRAQWGEQDGKGKIIGPLVSIVFGALIIGALRPTNTWDYPTYLAIGIIALVYTLWRYYIPRAPASVFGIPPLLQRLLVVIIAAAALFGLSLIFFEPFTRWYGQAYETFAVWTGEHTPFWSYLTQWGLFLFIIVTWMARETYDWMKGTPMSSLTRLRPYLVLIEGAALVLVGAAVYLTLILKIQIAWLVILLAGWAGVLIIRPGQSDGKRAVLFMVGTGLVLTLFVELFVLVGDIGRMNTVFKFYFQAWTLFALSAGAGIGWLIKSLPRWHFGTRMVWQTAAMLLVAGAALYPITAAPSKI